jgi:hypothetical protein
MQENKTTTIHLRSFAENTYTSSKITMQTLVVTPSFKKNTIECQKSLPSTSVPSLIQPITQIGRKKSDLTMSE